MMKVNIDRRVKMIPIMEINAGDEVSVGGFDYVVDAIHPRRKEAHSDAYGIKLVMSSYKHRQLVKRIDGIFSIDSILVFLPKGDSIIVECTYRELEECFPKT